MHIKTGTWETNNAVCESDRLCDSAGLVSPAKPEPHIRNRHLSPGSGSCGGGGSGCAAAVDKLLQQEGPLTCADHVHPFPSGRDRERRAQNKGRGPRRDKPRPGGRAAVQKARWAEDSLALLKPPPAFPVKDSPAKLQPAVSYASKVKAGGGAAGGSEEPPAIGVLLQNQWGLSFISDGPVETPPSPAAPFPPAPQPEISPVFGAGPATTDMDAERPVTIRPPFSMEQCCQHDESSGELLLNCRHLVEAMQYHTLEWDTICRRQKEDPVKVVWYKHSLEKPA
ncbi:uncharacterized protein LOC114764550 [Denticeps clupeoides]|uniref:Uncharacterized protein n=1 Tax=Denticeps clupeoides TaxID=299321 RepID=A0AAY4AU53_9TELE|nr:uncharacterized protein LOC114764550 [Denticeps clupeoides]